MFQNQNWKTKIGYIGFGSIFGCLFTIIGMLASDVTAQRDKFGEIECTKLTVVDEQGSPRVVLGGGYVSVDGIVHVYARDEDKEGSVILGVDEHGGLVTVFGGDTKSNVGLSVDEHGGGVRVWGEGGRFTKALLSAGHSGFVSVYGADGTPKATLGVGIGIDIDENSGYVRVVDSYDRIKYLD